MADSPTRSDYAPFAEFCDHNGIPRIDVPGRQVLAAWDRFLRAVGEQKKRVEEEVRREASKCPTCGKGGYDHG